MQLDQTQENEKIEGTVFNPRQVRILKYVVIILGVLLVAGFGLVIGAIVYQAAQLSGGDDSGTNSPVQETVGSEKPGQTARHSGGMTILSTSLDGSNLAITFRDSEGFGILVVHAETGKVLSNSRINLPF